MLFWIYLYYSLWKKVNSIIPQFESKKRGMYQLSESLLVLVSLLTTKHHDLISSISSFLYCLNSGTKIDWLIIGLYNWAWGDSRRYRGHAFHRSLQVQTNSYCLAIVNNDYIICMLDTKLKRKPLNKSRYLVFANCALFSSLYVFVYLGWKGQLAKNVIKVAKGEHWAKK